MSLCHLDTIKEARVYREERAEGVHRLGPIPVLGCSDVGIGTRGSKPRHSGGRVEISPSSRFVVISVSDQVDGRQERKIVDATYGHISSGHAETF